MATGRVRAVQDLRRSNAAGAHQDRRTGRNRTRGQREQTAIGEQLHDDETEPVVFADEEGVR
jgi:hypothetical protein